MNKPQNIELNDPGQPSDVTPSGIVVPEVATPDMMDPAKIGEPGKYPFTRGIFENGYRGRLWTFRQYSGFGSAEETNQRYKFLIGQGQTGLSVALDLPTQCGYDPIDPMAVAEVGKVGVSLSHLADAETLFDGLDLAKLSTSFTINGTAAMVYALYLAVADKRGIPRAKLTGTIQNDILKEYVARGTWIFPVRPSMRLIADSILYSNEQTPRFNPISIAGAHVRDAGATAVEEIAFTLVNAFAYVDDLVRRGGDPNSFAKRLSFFFYVHMDFFEEICRFRAARRIWARTLKERYGVTDEKAQMFRFGVVCGGASLTAQQPYNNIVRVGIENMAAVLGGAQSIFTAAYDEAFQIPTETSAEIALRTQQIVAYESGVARTVDPLGGSYFVEWMTDKIEEEIEKVIKEIDDYGGAIHAIEDGYLQMRIARRAYEKKLDIDRGARVVVGENYFRHAEDRTDIGEVFKVDPGIAGKVRERYQQLMDTRDDSKAQASLAKLREAALDENENIMPWLVDCCHAYATVGEMVTTLKREWGEFQEPVRL
ncbi:MAG: methylmalonyl-CoA mutase [Gammaproteobacteria bacterium]|nr:methylmalonyl-CoA mutase [Gammaproteobacteria bacterium]